IKCEVQQRNESAQLLKKLMYGEFEMIPTTKEVQMAFVREGNSVLFFVNGEDGMIRWDAFSPLIHVNRGFYIYTHSWGDQEEAQTIVKDAYIIYE
ncbi:MAG TPA: hypothetical protein VJ946_07065, partial [Bacteroidales bacterium]|nr:hypothetical protein [Bacteroidales bacterium]